MSAHGRPPRRRRVLKPLLVLALLGELAAMLVGAFQVGLSAGLALAGGGYVLYAVPAAIFDWPRLSLADIGDFLLAIVDAVVGFFTGLFD
jgi:hypothetical protein